MKKNTKIGMFGYGCAGQGLHDVLNSSSGFKADIVRICVKDRHKKRRLPMEMFTFNKEDILQHPEVDLVVELIDDADEAFHIVKAALESGKNVVTANKKMVAEHLEELVLLQEKHKVSLLYEAAVCGSIPIIRNLEEYYDNELLYSVRGIFNGSSNYILSNMFDEGKSYETALKEAQEKGFAETDPGLDVDGYDPKFKLLIIILHAYGLFLKPEQIFNYGISRISKFDMQYAREKGYKIKLVPHVTKRDEKTIAAWVIPRFISPNKYLYIVDNEYNGVIAEAAFSEKQFFYGKGAGGHPTGSAVLSDISANSYDYKYEYKKRKQGLVSAYTTDIKLEIYLRYKEKAVLEKFSFERITQSYSGPEYHYVIGDIHLENLFKLQEGLKNMDVFIAGTGKYF